MAKFPDQIGSAERATRVGQQDLAARMERLPFTKFQVRVFAIIATAWLFDSIGKTPAFAIAAGLLLIGASAVALLGPETKGKMLEDVSS